MADGPAAPEADIGGAPHNIEAGQALLGALRVNNDVCDRVASILRQLAATAWRLRERRARMAGAP